MALTLFYVYEQDYLFPGWADDGGAGMTMYSWYDHDLAGGSQGGGMYSCCILWSLRSSKMEMTCSGSRCRGTRACLRQSFTLIFHRPRRVLHSDECQGA